MFFSENHKLILENGLYRSIETEELSYPEDGYDNCFQIEDNSFWFKHRNKCIYAVIRKFAKEKVFFDVGGGNGYVSKYLQDNGLDVYLTEPAWAGILNARKRGVKNLINSSLDENFRDESIPNIGIFDVLEHIENDIEFLRNINNKLKTEGLLFLSVPAYSFLWSNADKEAGHFRRYTLRGLNKKLFSTNYKVVYSTYIFSILPLPIFIFRTLPSFFFKSKNKQKRAEGRDHKIKGQKSLIEKFFDMELTAIQKKRKIVFGGSCLIVAQKK